MPAGRQDQPATMGRAAGDRLHAPQQAPIRQLVSRHIFGEALGAHPFVSVEQVTADVLCQSQQGRPLQPGLPGGRTATNTITLTLLPRVREADYGSVPLPGLDRPEAKALSPAAAALAQDIRALLLSAIQSVATDYDQTGGKAVRPPMATAGIDIELALTLTSKGTIGIEKAWTLPAGIELSNTASSKSANTIKLSFARE